MTTKWPKSCAYCGKEFLAERRRIVFCSNSCARRARPQPHQPVLARFLANVPPELDSTICWPWQGYRWAQGYGGMCVLDHMMTAHRVAYLLFVGPIPKGLFVLHRCDNPPCCNPAHLFVGTQQENVDDCRSKGRSRKATGENHPCAKLSWSAVFRLRHLHAEGGYTQDELAAMFAISASQVRNVIRGRSWKTPED